MARARLETEHDRTARLMAFVANMLRDPKKGKAVNPDDLNPYADPDATRERRRTAAIPADIHILRTFLPPTPPTPPTPA